MLDGSMFIYDRFDDVIPDGKGFIWVAMITYICRWQWTLIKQKIVSLKFLNDLKVMVVCPLGFCLFGCLVVVVFLFFFCWVFFFFWKFY